MRLALGTILVILIFAPTRAQEAIIQFPPGSAPATLKGHVNPLSSKVYELTVSANQRVAIHLTSTSRKKLVAFSINRNRYTGKPLAGADAVKDWEGVFREGGDYWISVFASRDAGEEDFTLVISAPPESASDASNNSSETVIDAGRVATTGAKPEDFVPPGWKIARHIAGDLNGDGRPDQVLQLVTATTPDVSSDTDAAPEAQALLILFADGGKFRRGGLASKLLTVIVPQYSLDLKVTNGVLVVQQDYGMNDVTSLTHRFRFDSQTGRFLLIGRDAYTYTRPLSADTVKTSENYLTGVRLTTTGHFRRGAGTLNETTKREQMPVKTVYFEDVDENSER